MKRQAKVTKIDSDYVFRNTFGLVLSELMDERAISQDALAAQTGITQSKVSRYARGKNEPKLADLAAICKFFNVSPETFLELGSPVKPLKSARQIVDKSARLFGPEEHKLLGDLFDVMIQKLQKMPEPQRLRTIKTWSEVVTLMIERTS